MAKYRFGSHIAPELPSGAYGYSYRIIGKAGDYLSLWLSNTPFVYAQYGKWPSYAKGWCLPYTAPNPGAYIYHIGVDNNWWKSSTVRTEYGSSDNDEKEWIVCHISPSWSNVDIYNESGGVALAGSAPVLYCPDSPIIDAFYNVLGPSGTVNAGATGAIIPQITDETKKYLYGNIYLYLKAHSPDGAYVKATIYCNGSIVASTDASGTLEYHYKIPTGTIGTFKFHAVVTCYYQSQGQTDSESVTTNTVISNIIEYDINNYDPTTGTDTSGTITPGSVVSTSTVDTGDSTVTPSGDSYGDPEDPISGEVDWGDDNSNIDITEDDPEPPIIVDDITQEVILKDGVGAMSYYLGYRIGKMIRGQMNGFDDVDAELINGVLYIRDATVEQTETLLEVT